MEINTHLSSLLPALGELPSEHAITRGSSRSPVTCTWMQTGELSIGKPEQAGPEKDKDKDQGDFFDLLAKHTLQEAGENGMK